MGNKLKYKKGDIIYNGKGKYLGEVQKAEKSTDPSNDKNKYELLLEDGSTQALEERNIYESSWHKKENG